MFIVNVALGMEIDGVMWNNHRVEHIADTV